MAADVIADLGYLFLGSRLKRLAERLQADAAKVHRALGIDAQPAELALLAAVDCLGSLTVSGAVDALGVSQPAVTRTAAALVERGLLAAESGEDDQRQRVLALTRSGKAIVVRAKQSAWPAIDRAVTTMCAPLDGPLLDQISALERQLEDRPLEARALDLAAAKAARGARDVTDVTDVLAVREYADDLAQAFYDINAEWISAMFVMEKKDREVLSRPRETILDPGGRIFFVESKQLGVIGTCALMKTEEGVFELTKMGVRESARGRGAGELLLETALACASTMDIDTLYLLTNSACRPAITLYEKLGFEHDAEILATYGAAYARCDVAMIYRKA